MIFKSIPSYLTHPVYCHITSNYENVHTLSDHNYQIKTIISWILSNNILLNYSKSALLNIPSNYHYFPLVVIDGLPIIPSSPVLNLGVILDANLSLNSHIANISKSANYHLLKIRLIRNGPYSHYPHKQKCPISYRLLLLPTLSSP